MNQIKIIKTVNLTNDDIPQSNADWHEISLFALSFDIEAEMQAQFPSPITSYNSSSSLTDLRSHLYHQQRWWNNRSGPIEDDTLLELRKIIELIRAKVNNQ
jgi:hypothetical protein